MSITTEHSTLNKLADSAERETITSAELARAIINSDGAQTGMARGRARYMHARRDVPDAAKRYLETLIDALSVNDGANATFHHPRSTVRPAYVGDKAEPLTPVDLAWLAGLPSDPEKISYRDACHLAKLAQRMHRSDVPETDRRLVEQRWEPVADVFDLREAERISQLKYRTVPDPTDAFARLIADETVELTENECYFRAQDLTASINQQVTELRQRQQAEAQRLRDEVAERVEMRTSTEAPTPAPLLPPLQRE